MMGLNEVLAGNHRAVAGDVVVVICLVMFCSVWLGMVW